MRRQLNTTQQGAAIIVALFVTAIVAIAAIAMIDRFRVELRRTSLVLNDTKAYLYAQGSIAWAIAQLNSNLKEKKTDRIVDMTPIQSPVDSIDNFTISSIIYDQEGLFNLNNLTFPEWQEAFLPLLTALAPQLNTDEKQAIMAGIRDWVSPAGTNAGLEEYYAKQTPAYRSPHKPMASITELRLIKGITPALFRALAPYVTALPETTTINVNNAPIPVLLCLSPTLTADAATAIDKTRKENPFVTTTSFQQNEIVKNHKVSDKKINVTSSYFLLKTNVKINDQNVTLYTLLHRLLKNAQPITVIVWQSKGTLSS